MDELQDSKYFVEANKRIHENPRNGRRLNNIHDGVRNTLYMTRKKKLVIIHFLIFINCRFISCVLCSRIQVAKKVFQVIKVLLTGLGRKVLESCRKIWKVSFQVGSPHSTQLQQKGGVTNLICCLSTKK